MDIRDLKTLAEVVACSSFTGAAERLGYTQSAVSQQIANLEAEVGQPLLHRRPVTATPAGARLVEHAGHMLRRLDVAMSELRHLERRPVRIRVSVSPLADRRVVGRVIAAFSMAHPDLDLSVAGLGASEAVAAVAAGDVDAALVDGLSAPFEPLNLADSGLLSARFLAETAVVVALAAAHPLARRRTVDLDTLIDGPWIASPWLVDQEALVRLGVPRSKRLRATYESTDVAPLLAMVAAEVGIALLPAPAAYYPGVVPVPLARPVLAHRTELLTLRTSPWPVDEIATAARVHPDDIDTDAVPYPGPFRDDPLP